MARQRSCRHGAQRQLLRRKGQACPRHLPPHEGKLRPAPGAGSWRHRRCPQSRAERFDAVAKNAELATTSAPKGTVYYISLNQKNANLAKPEVAEAFKYLVDYDALGSTLIKGIGEIHQTFLPKGVLGELDENPYKLDVAKAKELLAKAGLPTVSR
jgi:ABC-type transport system substrate-binding protein